MGKVNRRINAIKKDEAFLSQSVMAKSKRLVCYCQWFMVVSVVAGLVSVAGFYSIKVASNFLNRPIGEIIINGDFKYITQDVIRNQADSLLQRGFISESIHHAQTEIQSLPWVDEVTIARAWPNRLIITVYEQVPIARWGNKGFVNIRGELIFTTNLDHLAEFPELSGEELQIIDIIDKYSVLTKMLNPYALAVSELQKDTRGSWIIRLKNQWHIVLGKGEILQKMHRLTHLIDQQLISSRENIELIDLRYSNGVSVKWKSSKQKNEQTLTTNTVNIQKIKSTTESGHVSKMANIRG